MLCPVLLKTIRVPLVLLLRMSLLAYLGFLVGSSPSKLFMKRLRSCGYFLCIRVASCWCASRMVSKGEVTPGTSRELSSSTEFTYLLHRLGGWNRATSNGVCQRGRLLRWPGLEEGGTNIKYGLFFKDKSSNLRFQLKDQILKGSFFK
ncbi:hypothetical protein PROFUN_00364 [Planoprotostelium fungivorum]|uniref:Uncharacterized protein n=1 Tax=Planoprotostelium fungivorum TaxID=1890364 RepID=A0A2P6NY63_9EUKA|nr:hypothetical protein PROFUN_00364 [Planoprotostelium fungivorum]